MNLTQYNSRQKIEIMSAFATLQSEHEKELKAKDDVIEYYRRAAENATRSKHRALHRRSEQRKDLITFAVLMVSFALFALLMLFAVHEGIMWASGR